jgi:hypothetical protein
MRIPPGTPFTLLETTSYFEAYRPILQALQNIKDDQLPLEKYLLHCDTNVALPNYFENKTEIDFRPILVKNNEGHKEFDGNLSSVKDLTTWPNAKQLGLDESQHEALQAAITKAVAVIQGKFLSLNNVNELSKDLQNIQIFLIFNTTYGVVYHYGSESEDSNTHAHTRYII